MAAPQDEASSAVHARAEATSVRPGVNDRYAEADSVGSFVDMFESEGREVRDEAPAIIAALGISPGDRVADVGAGTGLFMPGLAEAVGPSGQLRAVDIIPKFLARLRERAEGLSQVQVVEGTPLDVSLPVHSQDLIVMIDVYHHVEFPAPFMASVHDALVVGGELVIVDFRRIEGTTSERMLKHVRADQSTVRAEVESRGFEFVESRDWMRENYFMRFRRRQ